MRIKTKEVQVEAHWSNDIVEHFYASLQRAYIIIASEMKVKGIDKELMLQIAVKAVNDTAGPRGLMLMLNVFHVYPRICEVDPPAPDIFKRANAIKAAMKEVRKYCSSRQVHETLCMRNRPYTNELHQLQDY